MDVIFVRAIIFDFIQAWELVTGSLLFLSYAGRPHADGIGEMDWRAEIRS
jgi:hypothetical protein